MIKNIVFVVLFCGMSCGATTAVPDNQSYERLLQYQMLMKLGDQLERMGHKEDAPTTPMGHLRSICAGMWKNGGRDLMTQVLIFTLVIRPAIYFAIKSAIAPENLIPVMGSWFAFKGLSYLALKMAIYMGLAAIGAAPIVSHIATQTV